MVRQDAQKTNAYQSNKTILLSDRAVIDTKPQLDMLLQLQSGQGRLCKILSLIYYP